MVYTVLFGISVALGTAGSLHNKALRNDVALFRNWYNDWFINQKEHGAKTVN